MEKYIKISSLSCHVLENDIESMINRVLLRWHNLKYFNEITQRLFNSFIINGLQTTIPTIFSKDFGIWLRHKTVS